MYLGDSLKKDSENKKNLIHRGDQTVIFKLNLQMNHLKYLKIHIPRPTLRHLYSNYLKEGFQNLYANKMFLSDSMAGHKQFTVWGTVRVCG